MPGIDINSLVQVASLKPSATTDGKQPVANPRAGRYTEQYTLTLIPTTHLLADEGSYFVANNGQTGQVSAAGAPVSFVATTPWAIIYNNASPANPSSPKIYLDYVSFAVSLQGATMTSVQMAVVRDLGNRFSALGTGGALLTATKLNSAGQSSIAQVWTGGQMTATAATAQAATIVGNRILTARAAPASVTGDVYSLAFGSVVCQKFLCRSK
jgi:hypothetical protein